MSSPTPHRFNNPLWEFGDILGCLMDPNPANFGRFPTVDDYRSELRRARWYKRGKPPLHDENPSLTLLHWLQRGDLTAFDKQEDKWLTKKDWVNKDEKDVANGVRRYVAERIEALQLIQQKHERQAAGAADSVFDTGLNDPGDPPEEPYQLPNKIYEFRQNPDDPLDGFFIVNAFCPEPFAAPEAENKPTARTGEEEAAAPEPPAASDTGNTADGPDRETSDEGASAGIDGSAQSPPDAPVVDAVPFNGDEAAEWIFRKHAQRRTFEALLADARQDLRLGTFRGADFLAAYRSVYATKSGRPPITGWPLQPEYKKRAEEESPPKSSPVKSFYSF